MTRPSSQPTVLVTGADGFTGRHLCALLRERGHRVVRLVEKDASHDAIAVDLLDRHALRDAVAATAPAAVIHLAAIAFPAHGEAQDFYRVNVEGTFCLLDALARAGCGRSGVLLPSTATVYAGNTDEAIAEDSPLAPASHYAVSKLAMEQMARLFASTLPVVLVRPFNYTGPGQCEPFLVPKVVRHFAERAEVIDLGNIDVERDFLDVRTVVDAYVRLLTAPDARGHTFNVCSGTGHTVRSIISRLERLTGHRVGIRVDPRLVRTDEPRRTVGSNAKLVRAIGPLLPIPLETTLSDMLAAAGPGLAAG